MQKILPLMVLPMALAGGVLSAKAETGSNDPSLQAWFQHIAELNRPLFAEPAGPHGASGMILGAGISQHQPPASSMISQADANQSETQILSIPRIWLVKGFPWPVDLLFSGGEGPDQRFRQSTLGIQWNLFEQLSLPAIAIRVSEGRIFGYKATAANTRSLELATSYALAPTLTVFFNAGAYQHSMSLHVRPEDEIAFLLRDPTLAQDFEQQWRERGYSGGIRFLPFPPFVAISAEVLFAHGQTQAAALRLGFGL